MLTTCLASVPAAHPRTARPAPPAVPPAALLAEMGLRRDQPVSVPVLGVVGQVAGPASGSHVRVRVTGGDCPTGEVITAPRELVVPAHLAPAGEAA